MHFVWPSLGNYALLFVQYLIGIKSNPIQYVRSKQGHRCEETRIGKRPFRYWLLQSSTALQGLCCWVRSPARRRHWRLEVDRDVWIFLTLYTLSLICGQQSREDVISSHVFHEPLLQSLVSSNESESGLLLLWGTLSHHVLLACGDRAHQLSARVPQNVLCSVSDTWRLLPWFPNMT